MNHKLLNGLTIVALLSMLQAALRAYFALGGAGLFGDGTRDQIMSLIDTPVSNELLVIVVPFFLLGLSGAVAAAGLLMRRSWGVEGTLMVSIATVVYDAWASVDIQASALIGMIVPAVAFLYLSVKKDELLPARKVAA